MKWVGFRWSVLEWKICIGRRVHTMTYVTLECNSCTLGKVNIPTNILDFRGFDSSIILMLSGGNLVSIGNFLESLSQAILVGIMLVGRLGVRSW